MKRSTLLPACLMLAVFFLTGCQTAYYKTLETFGVHKRDVMVDRVKDARNAQEEAKEQFVSALDEFKSVLQFEGGDLEAQYNRLNRELERSEAKADNVHRRIDAVEDVSHALFREWENELNDYNDASLRRSSERQLDETRAQYERLMGAMRRAESKIEPVLAPFRDQVLFLKHNLNARAIASLQNELLSVENNIESLIREMEVSINEANVFINQMDS